MNREFTFCFADTSNRFLVHFDASCNVLFFLKEATAGIPRAEALNLAAWIVALVDPEEEDFKPLLEAIKKS